MKRFLIATTALLLSLSAQAQIETVLSEIAQNNLTLQALGLANEADVLDIKAGNTLSGPSIEYSPFFGSGYSGIAESELIVSEEIEFPTKYAARNKQAVLTEEVGMQEYRKLRRDILLEAEMLCVDIIRVNQTLQMLQQRLEGSQALRRMYEQRMEAGDANILEVNKVKLDCMEVQTLVSEAQNERTLLLQQLQQMNGGKTIDVADTEYPEYAPIVDYESFRQLALANNPDILLAEAEVRKAAQDVSMQKNQWLPNISLGYRRNTDRREYVNGVLVGVSFPVFGNGKAVKAARQRQQSAELTARQTRQESEALLHSRYQQYVSLQQVLDHSDVKMMTETLELYLKALQQGEITALQYYAEVNSIYEKLQRHIDVHCQSTKLHAALSNARKF